MNITVNITLYSDVMPRRLVELSKKNDVFDFQGKGMKI